MQEREDTHDLYRAPEFSDVCVASGWVAKVSTRYNQLIVEDGSGRKRRTRQFSRATVPFQRLVVTAPTGYISLPAIQWCRDAGVAILQLDRDGTIISVSGDLGADRPSLRRAQVDASSRALGLDIARRLVRQKLKLQAAVAGRLPSPVKIRVPGVSAPRVKTRTDLLAVEAEVAAAYWDACGQLELRFADKSINRIPAHWVHLGHRTSPISGTQRAAGSPTGAMLNLLYSMVASEARLACLAHGLDPGLGLYHVDKQGRDSLVYDIIEPVRPKSDEWLFQLLDSHTFTHDDFAETRNGTVRVNPPLSDHLAATGPVWARHIRPVVESIVAELLREEGTGAEASADDPAGDIKPRMPQPNCRTCGTSVGSRSRYCDDCRPQALVEAGRKSAARRLDQGESKSSVRKRSSSMRRWRRANVKWDRNEARPNPEKFRTEILPSLQDIPLNVLVKATGLSKSYCSLIRRGEVTPHPSHWDALLAIDRQQP